MTLHILLMLQEADKLPAPFRISPGLTIWTWLVFLVLMFMLSKTVFPAIIKTTAEREASIKAQLAEAQQARAEAAKLLEEQKALLASTRSDVQAMLAEARQASERERSTAMDKTRQEQEDLLARARQEIAAERERTAASLRRETVDLAIAAASKVIQQRLDGPQDHKLVEDYLATIGPSK